MTLIREPIETPECDVDAVYPTPFEGVYGFLEARRWS